MLRRRRATGGPAEQTFATLVGLELRPRKLREAAVLWERLTEAAGIDARDTVWQHPDLLPSSADLDEPAAFIDRIIGGDTSGVDIDAALAEFEKTESGEDEKTGTESGEDEKTGTESGEDEKTLAPSPARTRTPTTLRVLWIAEPRGRRCDATVAV